MVKRKKTTRKKKQSRSIYTICISSAPIVGWQNKIINSSQNKLNAFNAFKCIVYKKGVSIEDADILFGYVTKADDPDIIDLVTNGYSHKKQTVVIYQSAEIAEASKIIRSFRVTEFCLVKQSSVSVDRLQFWGTLPWQVVRNYLLWHGFFCQSPLEKQFWDGIKTEVQNIKLQHKIVTENHEYNVDFAIPENMLIVEIDGYAYHDRNRDDFVKERERTREIQALGWLIIPFAGREIKYECKKCISFVKKELSRLSKKRA